ncbi:RluA family pseudouridine synthase [Halobacillus andaensis]|uniref:RluA family pseudouridine synthase n=1 Tax=Halobacillus andaensis TaxID=1176239 RepID=UPI003D755D35
MIPLYQMTTPCKRLVKTWKAEEAIGLKDFLRKRAGFSAVLYKHVKAEGEFEVNGVKVPHWTTLQAGDELRIVFPEEKRGAVLEGEDIPLQIIYEDDDILVLHKPSGIEVSPRPNHPKGSIAQGLVHHYNQQGLPYTVHIVTRLDRYTSGLMLVAKHKYCHSLLTTRQDEVERKYTALVEGKFRGKKEKSGKVEAPIRRKPGSIIEREVHPEGKQAVTEYRLIKSGKHYSWLECKLLTGRTHQIRVHLSSIGLPLAGDTLYGGKHSGPFDYQALHCHELVLRHPWSGKWMYFSSDPPPQWNKY